MTTATGAAALLGALCLSGCGGQEQRVASGPECSLPEIGWRRLTFDPPRRVAIWNISMAGSGVTVNNRTMSREEAVQLLWENRNLRPSSYAILSLNRADNCQDVYTLALSIDHRFQCRQNYCFYRGSSTP